MFYLLKILNKILSFTFVYFFLTLIFFYQKVISKILYSRCRFYPSCSEYAKIALRNHKFYFAIWLICKRLIKCHPGCSGGVDEVPENN